MARIYLTTKETINNNYNNLIQQHCAQNNTLRAQGLYFITYKDNMNIYIKRYHHSRWGVDGECFIGDQKVCDSIEHPSAYLPTGEYPITKDNYRNYFVRGNGPMKNTKGEICLGRHVLQGFVLETAEEYWKLIKRINRALANDQTITLIILGL